MSATEFATDLQTVIAFDKAYIKSRPLPVQALFVGEVDDRKPDGSPTTNLDPVTRFNLALSLARQGYPIDATIDAYGGDPYFVMLERVQLGMLNMTTAVTSQPIKVSINPGDFPPIPSAPAPVPNQTDKLVAAVAMGNVYYPTQHAVDLAKGGSLTNGMVISEGGHTYAFAAIPGLVGTSYTWDLLS